MCGRFTLRTNLALLAAAFDFEADGDLDPRYSIAPTQDLPAVRMGADGKRQLTFLHWGLIPSWAKDKKIGYSTINARGDTMATKPAFRSAFKSRRCLILADGYYEWLKQGKVKQPYLHEVDGGKPFAFAGLWESWRGEKGTVGPPLESCTIITTEANELAAKVHDRMPVIIHQADYSLWLDPVHNREMLEHLIAPFDADRMTARPVSTYVNNARNQGPACIEPAEGEE